MDNELNQEILSEIDNVQDGEDSDGANDAALEQPENQTNGNDANPDENIEDLWKQTNEFKNGMWKTPDDIYKSVQYYQKRFTPFEETINKFGYKTPQDLEQVLQALPDYQRSYQMINNLHTLMSDPELSKPLEDAFKAIKRQQDIKQYGFATDELPPQIQKELSEMREFKREYEQNKFEQQQAAFVQTIDKQVKDITELCEKYNFDFDMQAYLSHCAQNNIPPEYVKAYFMDNYFDKIVENVTNAASLNAVNQNKQVKAGNISASTKSGKQEPVEPTNSQELREAIVRAI